MDEELQSDEAPQPVTRCKCGYPLLIYQDCPECGRGFTWERKGKVHASSIVLTVIGAGGTIAFYLWANFGLSGSSEAAWGAPLFGLLVMGSRFVSLVAVILDICFLEWDCPRSLVTWTTFGINATIVLVQLGVFLYFSSGIGR